MMTTAKNLLNSDYIDTKEQLREYIKPVFYTKKNKFKHESRKTQTYLIAFKYLILYSGNNIQNKQHITSKDLANVYTKINNAKIKLYRLPAPTHGAELTGYYGAGEN